VTGKLPSETMKLAPLIAAEFTVTADVPVEVSVTICVAGLPIVTKPKLTAPGATASCGFGVSAPVPLNMTPTTGLPDEVLLTVI
jgi:hypothetical protein